MFYLIFFLSLLTATPAWAQTSGSIETKPNELKVKAVTPPAVTPDALLTEVWKADLLRYGKPYAQVLIDTQGRQGATYYDTCRMYYTAYELSQDAFWKEAAHWSCIKYRDKSGDIDWGQLVYGQWTGSGTAAWNAFTVGLRLHYELDPVANARSKDAVHFIATHNWGATNGPDWGDSVCYAREVAYAIQNHMDDEALGAASRKKRLAQLVNWSLGHLDAMFVSKTALTKPPIGEDGKTCGTTSFMVGLIAHSLISYDERYQDPRVVPMLKAAMDGMWEMPAPPGVPNNMQMPMWKADRGGFCYDTSKDWGSCEDAHPALNPLVVPTFGYLWAKTGELKYRNRGDVVWKESVLRNHCSSLRSDEIGKDELCKGVVLNGGNYTFPHGSRELAEGWMWADKYLKYRSARR